MEELVEARRRWLLANYGGVMRYAGYEYTTAYNWIPPESSILHGKTTIRLSTENDGLWCYPRVEGALQVQASLIIRECETAVPDTKLQRLILERASLLEEVEELNKEIDLES